MTCKADDAPVTDPGTAMPTGNSNSRQWSMLLTWLIDPWPQCCWLPPWDDRTLHNTHRRTCIS